MVGIHIMDLPPDSDDIAVSAVVGRLVTGGFLEKLDPPFSRGEIVVPAPGITGFNINGTMMDPNCLGQRQVTELRYNHKLIECKGMLRVAGWMLRVNDIEAYFFADAFRAA